MHAGPNERYLQREDDLTTAAPSARWAVAHSNGTATDDHTDRFADERPEHLAPARAFATSLGLTGWSWRRRRGCRSWHHARNGRNVLRLGCWYVRLNDLLCRLRFGGGLLHRRHIRDRGRIEDTSQGSRSRGRRRRKLLNRSHEPSWLIILDAGGQLDAGGLCCAEVSQKLVARSLPVATA